MCFGLLIKVGLRFEVGGYLEDETARRTFRGIEDAYKESAGVH